MTTVSSTSGSTASSTVGTTSSVTSSSKDLQVQFVNLLVAEIQNQDPTNPMDASQYVGQLSQLSTLQSLEDLNTLQSSSNDQLSQVSLLAATNLVGKKAMAPASSVSLSQSGSVDGQVTLDSAANNVTVKILNSSGEVVGTKTVNNASAGTVSFNFDNLPAGNYTLSATSTSGSSSTLLKTYLNQSVDKVTLADNSVQLDIDGVGLVNLSDILGVSNS